MQSVRGLVEGRQALHAHFHAVAVAFGFDGEQQSLEAIERELGISRERVRKLEREAFDQLAAELKDVVDAEAEELADAA